MTEPGGGRSGVVDPPAERSSFVGRRQELGDVRCLLGEARLVTLVGPGGVGKTRLAARTAAEVRRTFPDGVAWADLGPVRDPALVATRVAAATGVRDLSDRWPVGAVAEVVATRRMLLVLDACEHVRDPCAVVVDALLEACPRLHVLAVSRRPLDVTGEAVLGVQPLTEADAVRLLVDRARAAGPAVDPEDDPDVLAELCRRLDGLPLAIELAAVRLRTLGPADLLARLEDRFRLLRHPGVVGDERHRTLRATMEWSRDLLPEAERLLWRRAAVFVRDFDLGAAEAVCGAGDLGSTDVLDAVDGLVAHSLLVTGSGPSGARYRMLDSVRAFGRELLEAAGETPGVRARHRQWCAGLVARASADFLRPGQVAAFDRLAAHHAELGAALAACVADPELVDDGLAMAADLWLYWEARGHLGEGRRWLDSLLGAATEATPSRPRALAVSGYLALAAFDPATARPLLTEARDLAAASGDARVEAFTTQYLGQAALFAGDLVAADSLLREAVARYAALDDRYAAFCLADLGVTALLAGEVPAAAAAFEDSLVRNEGGDPWTRSHALWGLGLVRLRQHDALAARRCEEEALRLMRDVDDPSGVALCVDALARVAAARADGERAARLSGAAAAVWRSIPAEPPAPLAGFRHDFLDDVRRGLGRRFEALAEEGRALPRAAAVAAALGETASVPGPSPGPAGVLTPRQREVAGLVAEGLTDREIAARLVISPRTAESHVEQILTRLGFRSRVEIAAWAAADGRDRYERRSGTP